MEWAFAGLTFAFIGMMWAYNHHVTPEFMIQLGGPTVV